MKSVSPNLQTHLQSEVTTLAFCWKIVFSDSETLGFTAHDTDIIFDGITYISKSGLTLDQYNENIKQDENLEILGIIDSDYLSEHDIKSGRLDNAVIEIFAVNYNSPDDGRILIRKGKVVEITASDQGYIINIKGLMDKLDKTLTQSYSPLCRARLGDDKCKINLTSFTHTGSVTSVENEKNFADSARIEALNYFNKGVIKFTSGLNNGFSTEVKKSDGDDIVLTIPFPHPVSIGDNYQITAGCDKKFTTCKSKFSNPVNFRGEPHIPGINKIFKVL